jgi:hypothetical protein
MDDVIEVMKLLCYEMMELQRNQQDPRTPLGQSSLIVWSVLQEQSDTLVQLLTTQTGQVRGAGPPAASWSPPAHSPVCCCSCCECSCGFTCQLQCDIGAVKCHATELPVDSFWGSCVDTVICV